MLVNKSPIKTIENQGTKAHFYRVQLGYRVEVISVDGSFYWHRGVFHHEQELWDWLRPQLEDLIDNGTTLSGDWMKSETGELYQGWFLRETLDAWEGYDPMTNQRHRASTLEELHQEINLIEADFCCS